MNKENLNRYNIKRKYKKPLFNKISLLGLFLVIICLSLFFVKNNSYAAVDTSNKTLCYKPIMVEQGDSLWSIANENYSYEWSSREEYISAIRELNNLSDSKIVAGSYISIPYYEQIN